MEAIEQTLSEEQLDRITEKRLRDEVKSGIQMIQYQVVTLMTTNGQAPFVTVFMYLNEAKNEQEKADLALIIEETLKQRYQGVKNEKGVWITPAFPKLIYVLEEDNIYPQSRYYYLTELAAKCTAKRMVPDYISEKIMLQNKIDKNGEGHCYTCMGCRSFLTPFVDEEGKPKYYGRFNQGVVTVNLVDIGLSAEQDMDRFWDIFDKRMELCHRALQCRHPSYWNKDGKKIEEAITEAFADYKDVKQRCDDFSDKLIADAYMAGGEKYADICALAYRQALAAHKVALDDNGDILFISKECFSNGCAATVDVSYPSIPLFLIYNPELLKGMLRPIYKFADSDGWKYDFAPHDVGQYPLVTGQVYGLEDGELLYDMQMPVEECGNMIIMETNVALATGDVSFAKEHFDVLRAWAAYLEKYGNDPENQLCTDDFAGHLAHNCNLSLKAIMGIEGMSILCGLIGDEEGKASYHEKAVEMANSWIERAKKPDGSYKLTFTDADEGTFSQKYNMVWDKIWGTDIFPAEVTENEIASNFSHFNEYGMPLDSRAEYTKADWLVWTATMAKSKADFKRFIAPLWKYYNDTPDRDPMTDWYDTVSCTRVGFIHRTVIAGLFIKTLDESGKVKLPR